MSSTGSCFDIGNTVRAALERFERTGECSAGSTDPMTAGNGSIIRLAAVAMYYAGRPNVAIERCAASSRTTHGALAAVDACRYLGGLLVGALTGVTKDDLLSDRFSPGPRLWGELPLAPEIEEVARGSFKTKDPPEIQGTGYVVRSLEAALWSFHRSTSFRDGCLLAANLGDDADTTAAVFGQLAGAFYGESGIPVNWREQVCDAEMIVAIANRLWHLSGVA